MKLNLCCTFLIAWQILTAECNTSKQHFMMKPTEGGSILCHMGCHCPPYATYNSIMCDHMGLTELPKSIKIPRSITFLSARDNRIQNISKDSFSGSPFLDELDLSENEISRIEDHSIERFSGLVSLHLSHNRLTNISSAIFQGLSKLTTLELGHNSLEELPENLFQSTPVLRELRLQSNNLKHLKEYSFRHLKYLEKLDLQSNGLSYLHPNLFQHTPSLQWLTVSDNNFQKVPTETFLRTEKLVSLDFSGNAFTSLVSGSFSTLYNLSHLYLNNLSLLQAIEKNAFKNMTNLKLLSCSYNSLLHFIHPEAFGEKPNGITPSEKLYLGHNSLRTIPAPAHLRLWSKIAIVDLNENPWRCDCNLRWMMRLRKEITATIRCETPLMHHGRTIASMAEEDFVCLDSWAFSTIFIMVSSLAVFCLCCVFGSAVLCYKTPFGQQMRAKWQFSYAKVNKKAEGLDLEWDPSADA